MSTLANETLISVNLFFGIGPSLFMAMSDKNRRDKGDAESYYNRKGDGYILFDWLKLSVVFFISSLIFGGFFWFLSDNLNLSHSLSIVCQIFLMMYVYDKILPL
jgi:hypothetical protein